MNVEAFLQFTTWNVERGEASIPNKAAAVMILEGLLGDGIGESETDRTNCRPMLKVLHRPKE